ncbi:hypothetical protein M0Q97_01525 [Candidatus Dojkabacteria bacterium]|jgi:hypothetical protein|nr:hypothetical protein [Candidatus Dojkabacteria bacterium]
MKKYKIDVDLFEKDDIVLTPSGIAKVLQDETVDDFLNNYGISVLFLEETSEHRIGSKKELDRDILLIDWKGKDIDIKKLGKIVHENLNTKFSEFVNEYAGKNKTLGFRYSKPNSKFTFAFLVESLYYDVNDIFKDIFDEIKLEEDNFTIKKIDQEENVYFFEVVIDLTAYSNLEVIAAFRSIVKESKNYDIEIILKSFSIFENGEPIENIFKAKKKIGY